VCRAVLGPIDAERRSGTFLAALRAYPTLRPGSNRAWLVTIAHRKAIDVLRGAGRRAIPTAQVPEAPAAPPVAEGPDPDLADAVTRLPAKQRQAVAYHYLAGMPHAEVAAILGGSTDAARRAAADGIATLRRTYPPITARKGELQ
jgi:RNA polymerase sigma factor (sigma-70 family)